MKRSVLLVLAVMVITVAFVSCCPAWAGGGSAREVSFPSGRETVHGILYRPAGKGPFPAILVVHEWWGLNGWVKEQAKMLAGQGYETLAVDLYRGQVATDAGTAHELMRGLPQSRGLRYLESGFEYLRQQPEVDSSRMGAVGWCMGGGYAMQLAIAEPRLKAVAINYGALEDDPAELRKMQAAILGNFGAKDPGITPADVRGFAAEMQKLGRPVDVKEYADAGHAFENPENHTGYRPADTQDADRRMAAFFAKYLK